ncbi:MAG: PTS system mannose/fructose/sorbose family transporter subunit IID [Gemmatimonadaceae bacterium]|jgi:PTS system mannose-specific IID component|nr:PTS system mannose/fructose/sorbose family transporter subunit IID [Gemmatimonadaceae bacterium]
MTTPRALDLGDTPPASAAVRSVVPVPLTRWIAVYLRSLAVQGSWNYEILIGNGMGFAIEPVLRLLPGGPGGEAYRAALARESAYFNAHPYLASVALGALARAELDGEPAARIERFRTALCGPLGAAGDRLVWAAWLPACAVGALVLYGLGFGPLVVVLAFLIPYNIGHLGLRAWGLHVGWRHGLRVASALNTPVLRQGPMWIGRVGAFLAGLALPLLVARVVGTAHLPQIAALAAAGAGAVVLIAFHGRVEGWRLALGALAALAFYSVIR